MIDDEHHAHHHHTGLPWLDLVLAGSAMLVSIISLFVSIEHGRTMERLVETNARQVRASTLPVLRFGTGNLDPAGASAVHFDVSNGGTGPAIIEWFTLSYRGQRVADLADLLNACCRTDPSKLGRAIINTVSGQTLSPGQSTTALTLRRGDIAPAVYQRLEK